MKRDLGSDTRLRVVTLARDAGSGYGGAEAVAYQFARLLDPARFRSWLCTTRAPPADRLASVERDRQELEARGVGVAALNRRSSYSLLPWRHLLHLLISERIDILHAHMPRASVPGAVLARAARVPVVISHEHGSQLEGKRARPLLDRYVMAPLSTQILAVSEWDRQQLVVRERIPAERIGLLPNGIVALTPTGRDIRGDLGLAPEVPLVGAVGRLYEEKGYDSLIEAIALLRRRQRALVCIVVGDGPEEPELQRRIAEHDLQEMVRLVGRRADIPDVIASLDVAVLPSRREGLPLALLEYMAGGAPIVATAVGGIPEAIEHERQGLLVAPQDPPQLADAIDRLLVDRPLGQRLGRAALARQRERYDLDVTVSELQRVYEELHGRVTAEP